MPGCEGCFLSAKNQQQEYGKIKALAIKFAKENGETVAIYKEGFEWYYCTAGQAIANSYPIREVISANY